MDDRVARRVTATGAQSDPFDGGFHEANPTPANLLTLEFGSHANDSAFSSQQHAAVC
jgi:hypothetical protein